MLEPFHIDLGESIEVAGHCKDCFLLLSSKNWLDKNGSAIDCRVVFNYIDIPSAPAPCMKGKWNKKYWAIFAYCS